MPETLHELIVSFQRHPGALQICSVNVASPILSTTGECTARVG